MTSDQHAFQVDLAGVVDLLSRHLYSGPSVYLRELLQNAVDAITARRGLDPACPAQVRLRPAETPDGLLEVTDTGIGLTRTEAVELLATIGRSSKRGAALDLGRTDFLGQFGIGLLSGFMVADTIELVSRSARPGATVIRWRGRSDGTYALEDVPEDDPDAAHPVGSTVRLRPRRDTAHWTSPDSVLTLATTYGGLLPIDVAVAVPLGAGERAWRRVTATEVPWLVDHKDPAARTTALSRHCAETLGFAPLASFDLSIPLAGLTGVAHVLPSSTSPSVAGTHRVYLKRMLLGDRVERVLPDWAFFVRCVIDTDTLRPTASREQLYEDEILLATRDELGRQVRAWVLDVLQTPSSLRTTLLRTHHLALRALAVTDDEVLDLVVATLPYETTDGTATLAAVAARGTELLYASSVEQYRQIAAVARAHGLVVVNAGYVYDDELLARVAAKHPDWRVREVRAADLAGSMDTLAPAEEDALRPFVAAATAALEDTGCEVVVRVFAPEEVPAVLLADREDERRRDAARTAEAADDLWGGIVAGFAEDAAPARLVLNLGNEAVRSLVQSADGDVRDAGVRALHLVAVLQAGTPLRARDSAALSTVLTTLVRAGASPNHGQAGAGGGRTR